MDMESTLYLIFLAGMLALRRWVCELIRVKGKSMGTALKNGDILFVTKADCHPAALQRGDIVICNYPGRYYRGNRLFPERFVKRLIGMPGETVEIREGTVYINGLQLEEPYLFPEKNRKRFTLSPVRLGSSEFFVLGDNRDSSNDSRRVGALPLRMLRGRVRYVVFPFRRAGRPKGFTA